MARATPARKPHPARRRSAGRPTADAPDLRERLLDAALQCFARQGIAATSLRTIAGAAGVNPALVHYYFGDKAQLQDAVVEARLVPLFDEMRALLERSDEDVASLVAAFVRGMESLVERHPWFPPLWVREVLCEGGAMRDLVAERIASQLPRMLATRLEAAQRAGRLNPELDPRLLVVSLVGLTLFPAAGAPIWRHVFAAADIDAGRVRAHTIALLDRGIGVG